MRPSPTPVRLTDSQKQFVAELHYLVRVVVMSPGSFRGTQGLTEAVRILGRDESLSVAAEALVLSAPKYSKSKGSPVTFAVTAMSGAIRNTSRNQFAKKRGSGKVSQLERGTALAIMGREDDPSDFAAAKEVADRILGNGIAPLNERVHAHYAMSAGEAHPTARISPKH